MNNLSLSIITITFNDLNGLKSTINSIDCYFNNSFNSHINHIIIDGNSNDGTQEYLAQISKLRMIETVYISEPDFGIYDAMNKGVLTSSSDFLIFINSGDKLLSAFFERDLFIKLNEILNVDNIAGLALACNYNFNEIFFLVNPRNIDISLPRMPSLHQGIIYKRSIILNIPYTLKYKICGDYENVCKIIKNYKFVPFGIIISELTAGGVSTLRPFLLFKESIEIFNQNFKPSFYSKIKYYFKIIISLTAVQFLFIITKIRTLLIYRKF
jgi:putative colanic acid biosynthesis glycosyltransferase